MRRLTSKRTLRKPSPVVVQRDCTTLIRLPDSASRRPHSTDGTHADEPMAENTKSPLARNVTLPLATTPSPLDDDAVLPTVGKMNDLISKAKERKAEIVRAQRRRKEAEGYETAAWWDYGETLAEIKRSCKRKGDWQNALDAIRESYQRSDEAIKIRTLFTSKNEAAKVTVRTALKLIRKKDENYGPYDNCFATPEAVRQFIIREYGFPGLDVAASHGMHFGENFYSPLDDEFAKGAIGIDALKQDWVRHCAGKIIFCNSPHNKLILAKFVEMAYEASQRGATVVCVLPYWHTVREADGWFQKYVVPYAEVRFFRDRVIFDGFGPMAKKKTGNVPGKTDYDSILVIFRPGQVGFVGAWIRLTSEPLTTQTVEQLQETPLPNSDKEEEEREQDHDSRTTNTALVTRRNPVSGQQATNETKGDEEADIAAIAKLERELDAYHAFQRAILEYAEIEDAATVIEDFNRILMDVNEN